MTDHAAFHHVGPIAAEVRAPAALIYQMLAAIGQGAKRPGERAEILQRDGNDLICDFWTTVPLPFGQSRRVQTRESVRLVPPDRIDYEHLNGPVRGLRESITVESVGPRRSRLTYRGTYPSVGRLAGFAFRVISRAAIERTMLDHFNDLRRRAEERAAESRLFRDVPAASDSEGAP
ncbi:MAG: hypothetical protein V4515_03840 [Chloroflexota bacterium]